MWQAACFVLGFESTQYWPLKGKGADRHKPAISIVAWEAQSPQVCDSRSAGVVDIKALQIHKKAFNILCSNEAKALI